MKNHKCAEQAMENHDFQGNSHTYFGFLYPANHFDSLLPKPKISSLEEKT